ncbi:PQQ-binding-like beta-propeller repeat protein [Actinoplanes sp. GCM10030250]|uniref:outer membrane protein assembly factor BamB family protein n=1 Tax=Actinoplanes sp. GCM10030250 TaxID=3273376 RepID=UPI0036197500
MTRVPLRTLAALVLVAATGLVGWRVLAPAEVLAVASTPYPALSLRQPGVTGRTSLAPLIVDGRLRVYAAKHQVKADAPADGRTLYTARWSFRRWPEQLSGVTASGQTVVTRWSDGELVALDARTGKILWRADGPPAPDHGGHRTGAATVWDPPGLHLAPGAVVVNSGQELAGYDVSSGAVRWQVPTATGCTDGFTTDGGVYVCATGPHDAVSGAAVPGWPTGPFTPVGCAAGTSQCAGFRDGSGQGWLASSVVPRRAPALDDSSATVAAGVIVSRSGGVLSAQSVDGTALWTWSGQGRVLGGTARSVVVLAPANNLVGLDAGSGAVRWAFPLAFGTESTEWKPGGYRIAGSYLAMERLNEDAPDDPESPVYYLTLDTVIIAALD